MRKKVLLKLSETQAIEIEGEVVYIDENVAKTLPLVFST